MMHNDVIMHTIPGTRTHEHANHTHPCSYVIDLIQHIRNGVRSVCGAGVLWIKILQEQVLKHPSALKEELGSLVANCQCEENHLTRAGRGSV